MPGKGIYFLLHRWMEQGTGEPHVPSTNENYEHPGLQVQAGGSPNNRRRRAVSQCSEGPKGSSQSVSTVTWSLQFVGDG